MDKKDLKVLNKILKHCNAIVEVTNKFKTAEELEENQIELKSALFDLIQIGELIKNELSVEFVKNTVEISWLKIYNLRNRIVHGYANIDNEKIFEYIKYDIPALISFIDRTK